MNEDSLEIDLPEIEEKIQRNFKHRDLLARAFVHKSYLNESPPQGVESNERLEFLGDAVIDLATAQYFYNNSSGPQRELHKLQESVIGEHSLAAAARELKLGDYLVLGEGEKTTVGQEKDSILEGCFEALVAAIFLEHDYDTASHFVTNALMQAQRGQE